MISGGPSENQPDESGDPLIDSLLEEVLGGQSPPDLTARIMARLEEKRREQPEHAESSWPELPVEMIPPELLARELDRPGRGELAAAGPEADVAERAAARVPAQEASLPTDRAAAPAERDLRGRRPRVVSRLSPGERLGRRGLRGERWRATWAGLAGGVACLLVVAGLALRSTESLPDGGPRDVAVAPSRPQSGDGVERPARGASSMGSNGSRSPGDRSGDRRLVTPPSAARAAAGDDPWTEAKLPQLSGLAGRDRRNAVEGAAGESSAAAPEPVPLEPVPLEVAAAVSNELELPPFGSVPFQPLVDSGVAVEDAGDSPGPDFPAAGNTAAGNTAGTLTDDQIVARVNGLLRERWQVAGLQSPRGVDDEGWCERVYQQLLGRLPQAVERREFLRDESPEKRARLVDRLMTDGRYRREFIEFWAGRWSNWLVADASRPLQQGLKRYLANALRENRPYDTIWTDLLTAAGTNQSGGPDHDDATNFLLAWWEPSGAAVVEQAGRVAWGQRVGCAQCHDDTFHAMPHERFWQAAAVFQPLQVTNLGPGRQRLSRAEVPDAAMLAEGAEAVSEAAVERGAPDRRLLPADLDGQPLGGVDESAEVTEGAGDKRREFAARLVQSPRFSRAVVNRLWGHFLQYGLAQPIDDMGPHNPTELPGVLEELATQFERRGYQLEPLMRWVVLSESFAGSGSIPVGSEKDFPEAGGPALFSWYYDRSTPLFAEASLGLQGLARGAVPRMTDHSRENTAALVNARLADGTVKQSGGKRPAAGANGAAGGDRGVASGMDAFDTPGRLVPVGYLRLVRALAASQLTPTQQVEHAVRVVLAREPRPEEVAEAERIHAAAKGDSVLALERVFWVLLNSRDRIDSRD